MITSTSLRHDTVKNNILDAILIALRKGQAVVKNRYGKVYMFVGCYVEEGTRHSKFLFMDLKGKNLADAVVDSVMGDYYYKPMADLFFPSYGSNVIFDTDLANSNFSKIKPTKGYW